MRIALLGDHPDGLALAQVAHDSADHELIAHCGLRAVPESLRAAKAYPDAEELLADPDIDAVIVAGPLEARPHLLRRALQSERTVISVYPPAMSPDPAYELSMIQQETGSALLPLLKEGLHPVLARARELLTPMLIEIERCAKEEVLLGAESLEMEYCVPGWDLLRALGGEVSEVVATAPGESLELGEPVLIDGRFIEGGLFRMTLLPRQQADSLRLTLHARGERWEILFPQGPDGPAFLTRSDEEGEEHWEPFDVTARQWELIEKGEDAPGWRDIVHALELDDAVRRSLKKRRIVLMEYPEANEEVTFKGTMTLVGCAGLWIIILLAILAGAFPALRWLKWVVFPLLFIFLLTQLLRWVIPPPEAEETERESSP